jgi:hypothetical protein
MFIQWPKDLITTKIIPRSNVAAGPTHLAPSAKAHAPQMAIEAPFGSHVLDFGGMAIDRPPSKKKKRPIHLHRWCLAGRIMEGEN